MSANYTPSGLHQRWGTNSPREEAGGEASRTLKLAQHVVCYLERDHYSLSAGARLEYTKRQGFYTK